MSGHISLGERIRPHQKNIGLSDPRLHQNLWPHQQPRSQGYSLLKKLVSQARAFSPPSRFLGKSHGIQVAASETFFIEQEIQELTA